MAFTKITYSPGDVLTSDQMNKIQDAILADEGNITAHVANKTNPHNVTPEQINAIPTSQKGVVNGVASLGADGRVPMAQLPVIGLIPATVE